MPTRQPKRSRPFIKVAHLEDLELSNRDLAIYIRLLWYFDDEVWRRQGDPGVAVIREEGLQRSQVVDLYNHLSNVIGPRLTASPARREVLFRQLAGGAKTPSSRRFATIPWRRHQPVSRS